ncbi:MAG TPA: hypothetical protein VFG43_13185 [Geminicoccaceae bacterium]|nr:hypothetical protein [Geminicoccaceae bacterium]
MTSQPLDAVRLQAAIDALAVRDAHIRQALARIGYPTPRVREPGFATLLRVIVAQQLSTRSAAAIWGRLEALMAGAPSAEAFLALDDAALRAAGLSAPKVRYGRGLATAVAAGQVPLDRLAALDEETVIGHLTALSGFGRWSAEIYCLFALGRIDSFPADDLALQVAAQRLKGLPARPTGKALRALAEAWRPQRGAAALFLWHYYGAATLEERRIE